MEAERLNASYSSSGVNEGVCWGCDRCSVPLALLIKNAFCFLTQQIIYSFRFMAHTSTRFYPPPHLWRDALCALHQAWLPAHLSTCLAVLWIQLKSNSLPTLYPLLLHRVLCLYGEMCCNACIILEWLWYSNSIYYERAIYVYSANKSEYDSVKIAPSVSQDAVDSAYALSNNSSITPYSILFKPIRWQPQIKCTLQCTTLLLSSADGSKELFTKWKDWMGKVTEQYLVKIFVF